MKLATPRLTEGSFAEIATEAARNAYRERERKAFGDLKALMAQTPALIAEMEANLQNLVLLLAGKGATNISEPPLYSILRSLSIVCSLGFPPEVKDYLLHMGNNSRVPLLFDQVM